MIPTLIASTEQYPIFNLLTVVLFSVVVISLILSKIKQSLLAGYFICGIILANSGLIDMSGPNEHAIGTLSELGVVLLMFSIGIEFSLDELKHLRRFSIIGGGIQMILCSLCFGVAVYIFHLPSVVALVLGAIISLSSTAVALKSFQEANKAGTIAAKMALGIALFQDTLAILLMAMMPAIVNNESSSLTSSLWSILIALGLGALFLIGAGIFGKYVVPRFMRAVAKTRSRELFTLSVLALCACIAIAANQMGLSLALGAFAAGLVVSGSYYSHRVLSEIMPFRDLFLTIFFVSAGFLVDLTIIGENIALVLTGLIVVTSVKFLACMVAASRLRLSGSMSTLASVSLSNVGEFSLVLLMSLQGLTHIPPDLLQSLYAITVLSMGLTPAYMQLALKYGHKLNKRPGFNRKRLDDLPANHLETMENHAVICGYGPVGKHLHESLTKYGIPVLIVDLNADTINKLIKDNIPAILGDIRHPEIMSLIGISQARFIAFTFPDISPALAAQPEILQLNPNIEIIARAKFNSEVDQLKQAGIKKIIHDEREVGSAAAKEALESFNLSDLSILHDSPKNQ